MDINRLAYLRAVARTNHLGAAAELIGISGPALSRAMAVLGEELGAPVIERRGRGIQLTPAGRIAARHAEIVVGQLGALRDELRSDDERARVLRLGSYEPFSTYVFGAALSSVDAPERAIVVEAEPGDVEQAVAAGAIDCGVTDTPIPTLGVEHDVLATYELAAFAQRDTFAQTPESDIPFAAPTLNVADWQGNDAALDGWPASRARTVTHGVSMLATAIELVAAGRVAIFVPTFLPLLLRDRVGLDLQRVGTTTVARSAWTATAIDRPLNPAAHRVASRIRALLERGVAQPR